MAGKKLKINVSVNKNAIPKRIKSSIKDGMRFSAWELVEKGQDVAESRIIQRDAIWQWDLIGSFETHNKGHARGRTAILMNDADHAAAVDEGAKYGKKGPPLAPLILYLMSKWGSAGFSNGPQLMPGSSGDSGTGRQKNDDVPENWERFDLNNPEGSFDSFYYGQSVNIYDSQSDSYLSGVVRLKSDSFVDIEINGEVERIFFGDNNRFRVLAGMRFGDLSPADQLGLINQSFLNTVRREDVSGIWPEAYEDMPEPQLSEVTDELLSFAEGGKDRRSMMRSVDSLQAIVALRESYVADTNTDAHIGRRGNHGLTARSTFGSRIWDRGGTRFERNHDLDTYNHEFGHLWLNAHGYGYDTNKEHSQLGSYTRGDLLDWDIDTDGFTNDFAAHTDPELFMLFEHTDRNNAVGWENIVEDVPDYYDDLWIPGRDNHEEFPGNDLLDPNNPRINNGDGLVVEWDTGLLSEYEMADSDPIPVGPGEFQYLVEDLNTGGGERLSVGSDGELFDGTITDYYDNTTSVSLSTPLNGQQYLQTDMSQNPQGAYVEAINRTLFTHIYARNQDRISGNDASGYYTKLHDGYGMVNAHETAAVMTETFRSQNPVDGDRSYLIGNIERIATAHPYLVETWLNLFEPSDLAKVELDRLGIQY